MRVTYKVNVWDMVRFNVVHQFLSPLMNGLFFGLAFLIFVAELGGEGSLSDAVLTGLYWYMGLWAAQTIFLGFFFYTRKADSVLTDHVLEIRQNGLFESTRFNESLFFWPGVLKVVRRPGFVAIYIAQHQAHVVPRSAFESTEEMNRFIALLRDKKSAV